MIEKKGSLVFLAMNAFFTSLFLVWLLSSVWFFAMADHDFFQRLGSFGVAVAIVYFGAVRIYSGPRMPPHYAEMQHYHRLQGIENHKTAKEALDQVSLIAAAIKLERDKSSRETPGALIELAKPFFDRGLRKSSDLGWKEYEQSSHEMMAILSNADEEVSRNAKSMEIAQGIVLVTSTLQWGFGDLLVCLVWSMDCCAC